MNTKRMIGIILVIALAAASIMFVLLRPTPANNKLTVAATFYPLYEAAQRVGGDRVSVTNITPAGAEPHDFEPSPQTLAHIQTASVFIYNGGNFEPWVDAFLRDYKGVAIKASDAIQLLQSAEGNDPHYWLDPVIFAQTVDTVEDALAKASPENASYFKANADGYKSELTTLNADMQAGLRHCRVRTIVTAHEAFTYFAKRYSLELLPIAGVNPDEEPSPAKLAEISQAVHQKGLTHIFFESLVSPRLADTIAQETGAQTATLDPIEGLNDENQKQGKNYLTIQRDNLGALRTALGCQ